MFLHVKLLGNQEKKNPNRYKKVIQGYLLSFWLGEKDFHPFNFNTKNTQNLGAQPET